MKDRDPVTLADLPCFGRPARLVWHKFRLRCPDSDCEMGSWTWDDPRIAGARQAMTDRAGRWATWQVGGLGRTVAEVARELGCDWHTVNDSFPLTPPRSPATNLAFAARAHSWSANT